MSVSSQSLNRAAMSAGLWFAVAYGLGLATGADLGLIDTAVDSAIMGTSALSSDLIHGYIGMVPTVYTSAGVTGALYAGIQRANRGDSNYLINAAAAGGNDFLVEWWASNMTSSYASGPPPGAASPAAAAVVSAASS